MHEDVPSAQHEYGHAMRELRRGIGCTSDRLSDSTPLEVGLRERIRARREEVTPDRLIMELTNLIDSIGDPKFRESLLVALRLDLRYQERSLTERRKNYNRIRITAQGQVNPIDAGMLKGRILHERRDGVCHRVA